MSIQTKIQTFGSKLSGMVIPNLGAFMAWGILTAIGVATGNEMLKAFIAPMLNYLLPLLIAFAGGRAVYGYRGGVIATVATMGAIVASDITMFIGAMVMAPLSAWLLKKFDEKIDGKIPAGFELLINNFSIGIIGGALAVFSYMVIAPLVEAVTKVLASGVDYLIVHHLLPLTALIIEPAKVLFLNNAIGQGILSPLATLQLAEAGKSVLYLLESNPGPGLGILLGYMFFSKGNSKASAYGASVIHFFGGIHEIYFPFVLMRPILIIPLILGGMTGTFVFTIFNVGLVGVASPGSIITIMMMAAPGDHLKILAGVLLAALVTFVTAAPLIKRAESSDAELEAAAKKMEDFKGKKSRVSSVFQAKKAEIDYAHLQTIAYACDAGLGSSAMGATVLQKKFKKAGIEDMKIFHIAVGDLPTACDLIVTHQSLKDRVKERQPDTEVIEITDYLNAPEYQDLIDRILAARK
ncbi:PTS mannitol transporter subunit IICB [Listeria ilorinensis]|uniref:PTS mannitol transporter subunit IICB n=1 Tax=Listeria ilorinensis TaxID=2867439 RepID=UPI001EF5663F|nr:PTS mannitol transporter subunit IICB [Listeria ilorinensis]